MNKPRGVLALILIIITGIILYFTYPHKIEGLIPKTNNNIEKIRVFYISEGKQSIYELNDNQEFYYDELKEFLSASSYRKRVTSFKGGVGDVCMIDVLYKDKRGGLKIFTMDIRETGAFICDYKDYQMYGKPKEILNKINKWIQSEGTLVKTYEG